MGIKISTKADEIADNTGGNYMNTSGVYDVEIKFASIAVSSGGAESVNFNLNYKDTPVTIYGPYITDKQGNPLKIGLGLINKLGIISGMTDGDELEVEDQEHTVGKDNKEQNFAVITNFSDLPIKIRVQEEYAINPNTNEIRKSLVVKSFFRDEDGASAEEMVKGEDFGKRLALETERYADNVTYRDDLTPEAVAEWKKAKRAGNAAAKSAPKSSAKSTTGSLFKRK